jgi:hypothetical protein
MTNHFVLFHAIVAEGWHPSLQIEDLLRPVKFPLVVNPTVIR